MCGGAGPEHPVECHEVWRYDDDARAQRLERMIALCPSCHRVKRMGKARIDGKYDAALRHLARVNGWTLRRAKRYVRDCFRTWEERSRHEWRLDVSILKSQHYRSWIERRLQARRGAA